MELKTAHTQFVRDTVKTQIDQNENEKKEEAPNDINFIIRDRAEQIKATN